MCLHCQGRKPARAAITWTPVSSAHVWRSIDLFWYRSTPLSTPTTAYQPIFPPRKEQGPLYGSGNTWRVCWITHGQDRQNERKPWTVTPRKQKELLAGALCRRNKYLKTGFFSTKSPRTSEAERKVKDQLLIGGGLWAEIRSSTQITWDPTYITSS